MLASPVGGATCLRRSGQSQIGCALSGSDLEVNETIRVDQLDARDHAFQREGARSVEFARQRMAGGHDARLEPNRHYGRQHHRGARPNGGPP
jgi:hypothetical protein